MHDPGILMQGANCTLLLTCTEEVYFCLISRQDAELLTIGLTKPTRVTEFYWRQKSCLMAQPYRVRIRMRFTAVQYILVRLPYQLRLRLITCGLCGATHLH